MSKAVVRVDISGIKQLLLKSNVCLIVLHVFCMFFQQYTTVQLMNSSVLTDISASTLIISVMECLTVMIAPMNLAVVSINK